VNVLGLDTSTAATAACLVRSDGGVFESVPDAGALLARPAHARELMPALARVVADAGLTFAELNAVAVGYGPGTFTGLRIGIATARAIASAHALPVHPVSSLAALAAGARGSEAPAAGDPVLAVIDARRGEVFAALHRPDGGAEWPPFVATPEELAERLAGASDASLAVGDGAVRFRAELKARGARVPPDDSALHVVRALEVCRLAAEVAPVAPEAVLPEYLRKPDAVPQPPRSSR
jgi:tRNA threonylcarbamoyladenosine biosynthesis protein TsaB